MAMTGEQIVKCRARARALIEANDDLAFNVYRKVQSEKRYVGYGSGPLAPWEATKKSNWFLLEMMSELCGLPCNITWLELPDEDQNRKA